MTAPAIARFEVDEDRWGRQYGQLRIFVRFPGYTNTIENNERVWSLIDALQTAHPEWHTKDGMLMGHVNSCGPDEILAIKQLR